MRCAYVVPYIEASDTLQRLIGRVLRSPDAMVVAVKDVPKGAANAPAAPAEPLPPAGQHAESGQLHLLSDGIAKGYTRSVNAGLAFCLAECDADLICVLNDDVVLPWNGAPALGKLPDDAGMIGVVSNRAGYQSVLYSFDQEGDFLYPEMSLEQAAQRYRVALSERGSRYVSTPLVHGFCFFVRPGVLRATGLLDAQSFPSGYGSDFDLSLRTQQAGYRNLVWTGEFVWHVGSRTAGRARRRIYNIGADFVLKQKYGQQYIDARFRTRQRLNQSLSNFLGELA